MIKKYSIDSSKIGVGTFGKVYKATLAADSSYKVAIKSLSKKKMSIFDAELVRNEIEVLHTVDHPNIVNYIETFEDEKHIKLVMEY